MEDKSTKINHLAITSGWENAWGDLENISGKYHHMLVLEIFVIFSRVCFWSLWEAGLWADGPLLWPSMITFVLSSGAACDCRLRIFLEICKMKRPSAFISIFPCLKYYKGSSRGKYFPQRRHCVLIGSKTKHKYQMLHLSCFLLPAQSVSIFLTPGLSVTVNHN